MELHLSGLVLNSNEICPILIQYGEVESATATNQLDGRKHSFSSIHHPCFHSTAPANINVA
eukprot:scaffold4612_cov110-Cylindrotheca_fusiformis.AAC.1